MIQTLKESEKQLEEAANGAEVEWTVRLSGSNVTLPEPEKTVLLKERSMCKDQRLAEPSVEENR